MKRYVTEEIRKSVDDEELISIEVLESKPKKLKYIIFVKR